MNADNGGFGICNTEPGRFSPQCVLGGIGCTVDHISIARAELRRKDEALERLAELCRIPREVHDPMEWHGGMAENIASCPTCVLNAALAGELPTEPEPRA